MGRQVEDIRPLRGLILHVYRPQRSWGKVMLLQASVILLTGGGYPSMPCRSHPLEAHPPRSTHPREAPPPREAHPPPIFFSIFFSKFFQNYFSIFDQLFYHLFICSIQQLLQPPPPSPRWSMSGRYASYWNAFLFNSVIHH